MLRILIASGMNPDLPTWQRAGHFCTICARVASAARRRRTPSSERASCSMREPRSPPETRSTVRHRSHGRPERTCGHGGISARTRRTHESPQDSATSACPRSAQARGGSPGRSLGGDSWVRRVRAEIPPCPACSSAAHASGCRTYFLVSGGDRGSRIEQDARSLDGVRRRLAALATRAQIVQKCPPLPGWQSGFIPLAMRIRSISMFSSR